MAHLSDNGLESGECETILLLYLSCVVRNPRRFALGEVNCAVLPVENKTEELLGVCPSGIAGLKLFRRDRFFSAEVDRPFWG
jgi:hypothetical protein